MKCTLISLVIHFVCSLGNCVHSLSCQTRFMLNRYDITCMTLIKELATVWDQSMLEYCPIIISGPNLIINILVSLLVVGYVCVLMFLVIFLYVKPSLMPMLWIKGRRQPGVFSLVSLRCFLQMCVQY